MSGIGILGAIEKPGYLEGGDFFPAGLQLCFVGVGLRSNFAACQQLMDHDWLGTQYVAVVKDCHDQSQDRMHLDCVFNITGFDSCLMLEDVMQTSSPIHRLVDEYKLDPITRRYHCLSQDIEFSSYVRSKGFQIVPVSREDQLRYACNVLNLGHGQILSADATAGRKMVRSPFFQGRVEV